MPHDDVRRGLPQARSGLYSACEPRPPSRNRPSVPVHADAPTLPCLQRKSPYRYQTFPTRPPKTPQEQSSGSDSNSSSSSEGQQGPTPLPIRQLFLLAFLSLSEQTALNSISPYVPEMVASMPGMTESTSGLYVGILASAFALAQLSTNFLWGYASDIVGRKPILLIGTFNLMCCFSLFGFCKRYWQILVVHIAMGMLNGNAACVPTVLGEVTDNSNQGKAFTYLPVIYSLGGITGPALGGLLVGKMGSRFPYLGPNVLGAAALALSVIVVGIWFQESLETGAAGPWRPLWLKSLANRISLSSKQITHSSWSSRWPRGQSEAVSQTYYPSQSPSPTYSDDADESRCDIGQEDEQTQNTRNARHARRDLLSRTTVILLATYLVFQLSNISFNSLYPIFAAESPPNGRNLSPGTIGVSLSIAGAATIVFQAFLYQVIRSRVGNLGTYRWAILGIAISMLLMPWIGYVDDRAPWGVGDGRAWLYAELGVILVVKNICAVGGLSSVMLLITNSAPSRASLGTLNGLAQTLSALGRSIGPFFAGGLFTLSTHVQPKGEALAWGVFGGLATLGWVGSLFIRRDGPESDDLACSCNDQQGQR